MKKIYKIILIILIIIMIIIIMIIMMMMMIINKELNKTYKFSRISHYWITYFEKGVIKTRISITNKK